MSESDFDGQRTAILQQPSTITAFVGLTQGGIAYMPTRIRSYRDFENTFGGLSLHLPLTYAVRQFFMNGGTDALIVRTDLQAPLFRIPEGLAKGLDSLRECDFNLLCIPPMRTVVESSAFDDRATEIPEEIWYQAVKLCEDRNAIVLIDPPAHWTTPSDLLDARSNELSRLISHNAALYFPKIRMPDPLRGNALIEYAPCGAVAGIIARTDHTRGVWKAPAGIDAALVGVHSLAVKMSDGENGMLTPLGINCLRTLPVAGNVIWGARVLAGADDGGASPCRYLPVRRLALHIERSLRVGLEKIQRGQITEKVACEAQRDVRAFMHAMYRSGAFQGRTPHDAYMVREIQSERENELRMEISFAPLKPAEFITINICIQGAEVHHAESEQA